MSSSKAAHKSKTVDFESFVNSPDLFCLKTAVAFLKTLAEEYRESIETRNTTKVRKFIDGVIKECLVWWEMDEQEMENLKRILISNFMEHFGFTSSITAQDATVMLKIVDSISKVCERAAKIQDGIVLKLEWGDTMIEKLQTFLERVVFPDIPPAVRVTIAMKAKAFFSSTKKVTEQLPQENIINMLPAPDGQYYQSEYDS